MIPILQAKQIKLVDEYTIMKESISSLDLMETASKKVYEAVTCDFDLSQKNILVVCGPGNNGGDGLALARMLYSSNYKCKVLRVDDGIVSEDNSENLRKLRAIEGIESKHINEIGIEYFTSVDFVIDAIFGVGINRKPEGIYEKAITTINALKATIISIDIPSGLYSDEHTNHNFIIKSKHTYTFQNPKLALMMPENEVEFSILDIGLDRFYMNQIPCFCYYLEKEDAKLGLPPITKFSHKGTLGHALIIAGGDGKMGAAVMAAQSCSKSGCGLITVMLPTHGIEIIQSSVPQAMALPMNIEELKDTLFLNFDAIGIGPGIGTDSKTILFVEKVLKDSTRPMVIDADALNILALRPDLHKRIPKNSILTPHPGEFRRLVGNWENDFDKLRKLKDFAKQTGSIILLKGAHTIIADPEGIVYFNSTGNQGMAKGGSGDVLTGIITGLLATKIKPIHAALTGAYIHGVSGNISAETFGKRGMNALDIIQNIPNAFQTFE